MPLSPGRQKNRSAMRTCVYVNVVEFVLACRSEASEKMTLVDRIEILILFKVKKHVRYFYFLFFGYVAIAW